MCEAKDPQSVLPQTLLKGAPRSVMKAEKRLRSAPFDTDAWLSLLQHFQSHSIAKAREVFDIFLQNFPSAANYWKYYIEKEIESRNFARVEELFNKCMPVCPDPHLFRTYIRYISLVKTGQPDEREALATAYQFSLSNENVGLGFDSSQLWIDYIDFLKSQPTQNIHQESEKISIIRGVYQKVINIPVSQTEILWKQYGIWEHSVHKDLAPGILAQYHPIHLKTLTAMRELKKKREGLLLHTLARPPAESIHAQKRDHQQLVIWRNIIAYEMMNAMRLDNTAFRARIASTFRQALLTLRHYPEIWLEFADFMISNRDEAKQVYQDAVAAIPNDELMYFLFADFHEKQREIKEAREVYDTLLKRNPSPLARVELLRFSRRCEGPDIARKTLVTIIKIPHCTYHVYVAAAQIEYQVNANADVATNIFNRGMKLFENSADFVMCYLDFLESRNDRQNMRVVLEKALRDVPALHSKTIWDRLVTFQNVGGDLQAMELAEKRRTQALAGIEGVKTASRMQDIIDRKHFLDQWPCSMSYRDSMSLQNSDCGKAASRRARASAMQSARALLRPDVTKMKKLLSGSTCVSVEVEATMQNSLRVKPNVPLVIKQLLQRLPAHSLSPPITHIDGLIRFIMEAKPKEKTMKVIDVNAQTFKGDASDVCVGSGPPPDLTSQPLAPPAMDMYRRMQASKSAKTSAV